MLLSKWATRLSKQCTHISTVAIFVKREKCVCNDDDSGDEKGGVKEEGRRRREGECLAKCLRVDRSSDLARSAFGREKFPFTGINFWSFVVGFFLCVAMFLCVGEKRKIRKKRGKTGNLMVVVLLL